MVHARDDYNRIQDPALGDPSLLGPGSTPIGEEEPVMLFRAQGKHFLAVLGAYERILIGAGVGAGEPILVTIREQKLRCLQWQAEHGCKAPDL